MKHGKKYRESASRYDKDHRYTAREALELVKTLAPAKFDETVEVVYTLGIDARKADQLVRGTVSLPNGTGKDVRVAVFCPPDKEAAAREAGADIVGGTELVEALQAGKELEADVAIATPDMMSEVGKLGRVLGPRGLMPNPKSGTVSDDVAKTVAEFKAGKLEYRNDRYGNVHVSLGKVSFELDQLLANLTTLTGEIQRAKPAGAKGRYMKAMTISSTMGPGVKVDPGRLEEMAGKAL
ncbi:MAG TPA: 50S ribosomal protein L1 [Acidimicrobiia bacterium]|jgi:large subunit ribosomal protein L1|nr:50S ribosomal protein L1 [Acidimicrobiia bacterium]